MDAGATLADASYLGNFLYSGSASPLLVTDSFSGPKDIDVFAFDASADLRLAISLSSFNGKFRLLDSSGSEIKTQSLSGRYVDYTFKQGRYYIEAKPSLYNPSDPTLSGQNYSLALAKYQDPLLRVTEIDRQTYQPIEKDPITGSPVVSQQQAFFIKTVDNLELFTPKFPAVTMPSVEFRLMHAPGLELPLGTQVNWDYRISYKGRYPQKPLSNTEESFVFPNLGLDGQWQVSSTRWGKFYNEIMGGDLDINASYSIDGYFYTVSSEARAETKNLKILGSNPSISQVNQFVDSLKSISTWPRGSGYSTQEVIKRIIMKESNGMHFLTDGTLKMNTGGDGGIGIMQITPDEGEKMPEDAIWNWQKNIMLGYKKLEYGIGVARRLSDAGQSLMRTAASQFIKEFRKEKSNAKYEKYSFSIVAPALTPLQQVQTAVRAYNGVGGIKNQYGKPMNEFEVEGVNGKVSFSTTINDKKKVITIEAKWARVPASKRRGGNERHYVSHIFPEDFGK